MRRFEIQLNPKVKTSQTDLQAQFDLMMNINKAQNEINTTVLRIRGVEDQVNRIH